MDAASHTTSATQRSPQRDNVIGDPHHHVTPAYTQAPPPPPPRMSSTPPLPPPDYQSPTVTTSSTAAGGSDDLASLAASIVDQHQHNTTAVVNLGGTSGLSASATSFPITTASGGGGGASGEKWIWVLDPMTRKLRVPMSFLVPTQATATMGTVPSLCIAFLEGRCRHPWCRQAHVLPHMIAQLRHDALNAPTCCSKHHDPHDTAMLTKRFETITVADCSMQSPIPTECIALTVGLQRYLAHSVPNELRGPNLEIPSKLICRLHLSHRCRYLEDCNNVHVCREFDLRLHPPPFMMTPLQNLTVTTRTITLGDVQYVVTPLAVGEVTDDEFHALCEQQQQQLHRHGGGGTSPLNNSTSTSPFLCGLPHPDMVNSRGASGTPENTHNGGMSPFMGSSSSPPNIQQQFALHNAAHSNANTMTLHSWGTGAAGEAIGTPTNSFSTPPLAFTRLHQAHQHSTTPSSTVPSGAQLGPSSFSTPPTGLPSFIGGDAPPAYNTNAHNASMAELIAKFGSDGGSGDKYSGGAGGTSPFLAADGAPPLPPPLFSGSHNAAQSAAPQGTPLHQHPHTNKSAAIVKALRVYDIRGVLTGSPAPSAAAPPTSSSSSSGHHYPQSSHHHSHHTPQHHHGSHQSHQQHYHGAHPHHPPQHQHHGGGGTPHYTHHHHTAAPHHHHNRGHSGGHHGSGTSSGTPSLQGSPVLQSTGGLMTSPLMGHYTAPPYTNTTTSPAPRATQH